MVKDALLAKQFGSLGHINRLMIVRVLMKAKDPMTAGELAKRCGLSTNLLSAHLRNLAEASIVERKQVGRTAQITLNRRALPVLVSFLDGTSS